MLPWKRLTVGADHIQDDRERMVQNLQFLYGPFPKRGRRPLVNHIIVTVDHGC